MRVSEVVIRFRLQFDETERREVFSRELEVKCSGVRVPQIKVQGAAVQEGTTELFGHIGEVRECSRVLVESRVPIALAHVEQSELRPRDPDRQRAEATKLEDTTTRLDARLGPMKLSLDIRIGDRDPGDQVAVTSGLSSCSRQQRSGPLKVARAHRFHRACAQLLTRRHTLIMA
jgi:hypothetical protein